MFLSRFSRFLKSHSINLQIIVPVSLRACFLPWLPGYMEAEIFNIQTFKKLFHSKYYMCFQAFLSLNPLEGGATIVIFLIYIWKLMFFCSACRALWAGTWEFSSILGVPKHLLSQCCCKKMLYHPEGPPMSNCWLVSRIDRNSEIQLSVWNM